MRAAYWEPEWTQCWMGGFRGRRHGAHRAWRRDFWQELVGERGTRADRGLVRFLVLAALAEQPRHGYEIMQAITERSAGNYKPSPGVIYPTLQMLEEMELVRGTESGGRKVFEITAAGRQELEANRPEVEDFYERANASADWGDQAEIFVDLAADMASLYRMYRQAARRGRLDATIRKAIRDELEGALERIAAILGQERKGSR